MRRRAAPRRTPARAWGTGQAAQDGLHDDRRCCFGPASSACDRFFGSLLEDVTGGVRVNPAHPGGSSRAPRNAPSCRSRRAVSASRVHSLTMKTSQWSRVSDEAFRWSRTMFAAIFGPQ